MVQDSHDFLKYYNMSKKFTPDMVYASQQMVVVDQEGLGSFLTKISSFISSKFDALKSVFNINGATPDLKLISKKTTQAYKDLAALDSAVKALDKKSPEWFKSISRVEVPCIPGVKVNMLELSNGLEGNVSIITDKTLEVLNNIDTYIGTLLANEEFRTSNAPEANLLNSLKSVEQPTTKYLTDIIDGKLLKDATELDRLYPNVMSFGMVHSNFKNMANFKDASVLKTIFDMITDIRSKVDKLHSMVSSNEMSISKKRLDELCVVLQLSAQFVTNIASTVRLLDIGIKCHKYTIEKITK